LHRAAKPARALLILLIPGILLLTGCPRGTSSEAKPAAPVIVSRGLITAGLNRYIESKTDEPFEQFGVTGVFARYDLEKEDLLEYLLGTRVPEPDLAPDTCSPPSPQLLLDIRRPIRRDGSGFETAIELIDVGNLSVSYGSADRAIPTRTFPDLLKVIDGVIYSVDEAQGVQFVPGETYSFHATGTDDVSPFEVVLQAPDDLGRIKVDGVAPEVQLPPIKRHQELELTWEGAGWGDEVVAVLTWTGMGLPWSMTCRMRDDGLFVVPLEIIEGLHDPLAAGDEELTLSRVRQVSFRSGGLSSGTFSFVVSTSFPVRFESNK
jgi:hypothetical protein